MLVVLFLVYRWNERKTEEAHDRCIEEIREEFASGDFIDAEDFLANWLLGGGPGNRGIAGYK